MATRLAVPTMGLLRRASTLIGDTRKFGRDVYRLAKLEAQLAAASVASVVMFAIAALILVITAWILLVFALVAWIAEEWLSLPAALLVVALVFAIGTVPLILVMKNRAGNLSFKATRRQLEGVSDGD